LRQAAAISIRSSSARVAHGRSTVRAEFCSYDKEGKRCHCHRGLPQQY
jgi:hypothetical protein